MFSGNDRVRNEHWCMNGWMVGSEDCPIWRTLNRNEAICLPSCMHRVCARVRDGLLCVRCVCPRTMHSRVHYISPSGIRRVPYDETNKKANNNNNCGQNKKKTVHKMKMKSIWLAMVMWRTVCQCLGMCCLQTHTQHSSHRMLDGVTYRSRRMSNPV